VPHTGFVCPDLRMASLGPDGSISRVVPIDTCLNCSLTRLDRACPYDYVDLLGRVENYSQSYSPSRMNGCNRQVWLQAHTDYAVDPASQHRKVRGTNMHAALEAKSDDIVGEARAFRSLCLDPSSHGTTPVFDEKLGRLRWSCDRFVSVQPDKIYPRTKTIHDDKTWAYIPVGRPEAEPGQPKPIDLVSDGKGGWSEFVYQLSVGAWAWAAPERVVYRDGTVDDYPNPIEITNGQITIRAQVQYRQANLPLVPFPELEAWMRDRIAEIDRDQAGDEPPPYIALDKRWRCGSCAVLPYCGIPRSEYTKERPKSAKSPAGPGSRRSTKRVA
jgi:hypothetical protein